jgi:pilus assembly protein Flp/PilA
MTTCLNAGTMRPGNDEMLKFIKRLRGNTRGATAVEYGLIVAAIVVAAMVGISNFAATNTGIWNQVRNKVVQ